MNAAEMCRANGWGPGTTITSYHDRWGIITARITAVGEAAILARLLERDGSVGRETVWNDLGHRLWRERIEVGA